MAAFHRLLRSASPNPPAAMMMRRMGFSALAAQVADQFHSVPLHRIGGGAAAARRSKEERNVQWVFLGCPGVGKGTFASRLSKHLGVPHIATGDLVRHELSSSGPLAQQLAEIVNQGKLVSDEIIVSLLSKHLEGGEAKGESGFILDGFPRTIKQAGNECEYRHSEGARMNPRDCWYWLNGNCSNLKCAFRHPPLDALFVSEPAKHISAPVSLPYGPAYNMNKQNVPCYYFQKGNCLKGDSCPFMHGQPAVAGTIPQQAAVTPAPSDPSTSFGKDKVQKETVPHQRIPKESSAKIERRPPAVKPVIANSGNNNGSVSVQNASRYPAQREAPVFESSNVPLGNAQPVSGPRIRQSHSLDEHHQNGKEADEFLGESSPGFDVLVDDQLEDNEYFESEENYGRASVQGGRNMNLINDFEQKQDFESLSGFQRDQFNEGREYDRYRRSREGYGREQLRISSERILDRPSSPERRMLLKEESYEHVDQSDLRHRLLEQRKLNGLRSAVSPDRPGYHKRKEYNNIYDEGPLDRHSHRDHRRVPKESSISNRFHGRITLPVRSLPDRPIDFQSDREVDKGRHRNRLTPPRSVNYQGRHDDIIKRKLHEDLSSISRRSGGRGVRRDEGDSLHFAGPKSLAELKGTKVSENSQDQKRIKSVAHQESQDSPSFEGPKPLSVILKRKRESSSKNEGHFGIDDESHQKDLRSHTKGYISAAGSDGQRPSKAAKGGNIGSFPEEPKVSADDEEGIIHAEGEELNNGGQSLENGDIHETEDDMTLDGIEDQELDDYDQRDGEYDYEEGEDGEFKTEDEENAYQEDEQDDDDDDDFAKKVSILLS